MANKQQAKKQAQFCVDQIKKQLRRGGRVLLEHPWNSDLWKFEPLQKLFKSQQLTLTRNDMCAFGLTDPQSGLPVKKPTGLAVSHPDMIDQAITCPGHREHRMIAGQSCGMSLSARCAEYTPCFVEHWLKCVFPEKQVCLFSCVQETTSHVNCSSEADRTHESNCPELEVLAASSESTADNTKVTTLLKRVHTNLGHPSSRDLVRIIKNAGGTEQAIKLAADIEASCDICCQRKRPTPALPAAPNHATEFNQRIGWDVKILGGWKVGQKVKCMNIVDYASSFQVMIPFFEQETADVLKQLYLRGWQQWAGIPEEVIVDPARTNTAESVFQQLEREGAKVITIAAEAHNQLGKVEKHGHLFEVILTKVLDQVQPKDRSEYEQCIVQTMNAKNELISQKGLSPCQLVFGRNPRIPSDLVQEQPCPVAGTQALHDSAAARSQAIRMHARTALVMAQDDQSMRSALNARPRVERDFLAGDYVAYWRSQKYEKGQRIVGGKWFGVAVVMGKVGRNFVVHHRRNIFKVAPEHLRHVTSEERLLAQTDGRELLGLQTLLDRSSPKELGSQYVDLTQQEGPEQLREAARASLHPSTEDYWLRQDDTLIRVHVKPRQDTFWPDPKDPVVKGFNFDDMRLTKRFDTGEQLVHRPLSNPGECRITLTGTAWTGESHFRVRTKRNASSPVGYESSQKRIATEPIPPAMGETSAILEPEKASEENLPEQAAEAQVPTTSSGSENQYGPVRASRIRQQSKGPPTFWLRPPEMLQDDVRDVLMETHGTKRSHSPDKEQSQPSKTVRTEEVDECLLADLVKDSPQTLEVLVANFLKKKMQKEIHHSKNPPELQEKVDASKIVEWQTLRDEKKAIVVIPPRQAQRIRDTKPHRIMTSRFVVAEKHEDGESKVKSRWCLRGHHDPDLTQKILAGKCHSPTLSQFGRSIVLQMLVSNHWEMSLGDIKGAFLEADVKAKALANPVFAELPPGGVPGIEAGSLVQIMGNIYGANDAPQEWYCEFDRVATSAGFSRSKFDNCLYLCYGANNELQGILGAHVDDTITGGKGEIYEQAIRILRERFPFRKWRTGAGEFLGTVYTQDPTTFEIRFQQAEYANHIQPIKISKDRAKKHWLAATDQEVAALRAVNGALGWLSSQTRPDLAVQTSISQQAFPRPTVSDLLHANQAVRRARQQSDLQITVPYIPLSELTLCFWSDAAFANSSEMKTQGGWLVAFTSKKMSQGHDVPLFSFAWKSYRLPRVVASTLSGEAQAFATASGVCEWMSLMLSECLDGPIELSELDVALTKHSPIGMTDCRSLYDHLVSLGNGGSIDDKRTAIDVAIIRQSIRRTGLEPRWCPTGHMVADGLTKDRAEPIDLLRSVLRSAKYQLADEQAVRDRKKAEKERRRRVASERTAAHVSAQAKLSAQRTQGGDSDL